MILARRRRFFGIWEEIFDFPLKIRGLGLMAAEEEEAPPQKGLLKPCPSARSLATWDASGSVAPPDFFCGICPLGGCPRTSNYHNPAIGR